MKVGQRKRVLDALKRAGDRGLCLDEVELDLSYTLRNRIGELERQGVRIDHRRCRQHIHRGPVMRYRLLGFTVEPDGQMAVAL